MNETLQTIRQRRSIRKFQDAPVPDDITEAILEAGRLAPSAMNRQERHFTVIRSQQMLSDLSREAKTVAVKLPDRYLSLMAQSENYSIFHNAPLVVVVSAPERSMAESDCAAAIQNMLLAAESLGYGGCWVNFVLFLFQGAKSGEYHARLNLPEGYKAYGSLAIGMKEDNTPSGERTARGNTVTRIL